MDKSHTPSPSKYAVYGAALAIVLALLMIVGGLFVHGESLTSYLWMWATMLMLWPAQHLFGIFGWRWSWVSGGPWGEVPAFPIFMVLVTDAAILALCGAAIGFVLRS